MSGPKSSRGETSTRENLKAIPSELKSSLERAFLARWRAFAVQVLVMLVLVVAAPSVLPAPEKLAGIAP